MKPERASTATAVTEGLTGAGGHHAAGDTTAKFSRPARGGGRRCDTPYASPRINFRNGAVGERFTLSSPSGTPA